MGSQAHANHVIKENKKLTAGIKSKRFSKYRLYYSKTYSKKKDAPLEIETENLDKSRFKKELRVLGVFLFVGLSISTLIFHNIHDQASQDYAEFQKFNQGYYESVTDGQNALRENDLIAAERHFRNGLKRQYRGKSAFLGNTRTTAILCRKKGIYCEEVEHRLEVLQRTKLSDQEKLEMSALARTLKLEWNSKLQ